MKILFAGGGTLGPVTPLLAVAEAWKMVDPTVECLWAGTKRGPERALVSAAGIPFFDLPTARFTRYPSVEWLTLPFAAARSFFQAFLFLRRERPGLIASAGGYTGVPLILVGRLLGIPSWIHQQDVRPLLSNRLCAPVASVITTAWQIHQQAFPSKRTKWMGNPVRPSVMKGKKAAAVQQFGLDPLLPTVLVFGGGTGASWLNETMAAIGPSLALRANVIHATGRGKLSDRLQNIGGRYHAVELFLEEMKHGLAAADVVVCRAGMGTITELAATKKAAIVIPLPNSAQEDNASILSGALAAVVLSQPLTTPAELQTAILDLLGDASRREQMEKNISRLLPTDVAERLVRHVLAMCFKAD